MAQSVGYVTWRTSLGGGQAGGVQPRRVVFVIFEGFQSLDLTGPYEVFTQASRGSGAYDCQLVAGQAGPVRSGSGLPVHAGHGIGELSPAGIDTLVVTGGGGVDAARGDAALVSWIGAAGPARAGSPRCAAACSCWPRPGWPPASG